MTEPVPSDRQLALSLAHPTTRAVLDRLFALDDRLGDIVRTTREPLVGQMRLTWWREALERLDRYAAPAEPLLRDLQSVVLPAGIGGADLAKLVEGWEVLLDPLDAAAVAAHGRARGGYLFVLTGRLFDWSAPMLEAAGEGWALADLATHVSRSDIGAIAQRLAKDAFTRAFVKTWPRSARSIGTVALLQMLNLGNGSSFGKFSRFARFRLTGR